MAHDNLVEITGQVLLSLIRQGCHPFRPFGQRIAQVIFPMPLEIPKVFQSNPSTGSIQESHIDCMRVAIQTATSKAVVTLVIIGRGLIATAPHSDTPAPAFQEHRDISTALLIDPLPGAAFGIWRSPYVISTLGQLIAPVVDTVAVFMFYAVNNGTPGRPSRINFALLCRFSCGRTQTHFSVTILAVVSHHRYNSGSPSWLEALLPLHEIALIVLGIEVKELAPLREVGLTYHGSRLLSGSAQCRH